MDKVFKPLLRGYLSKYKPFRDLAFLIGKERLKNRFLVVRRRDCDCYMLIDTSDSYGIGVLKQGKIETPEDEFVKEIIKPTWTVVDVGAHWGGFSILFGKLVGKSGKVFSFEPSSKNFKLLRKNIYLNRLEGIVQPFHFAVGDTKKVLKFPLAATSSGHNSLVRKNLPVKEYEEVEQIKLDEFLPSKGVERIDFLKMDIEGYEYFALKGAENLIRNSPKMWLFMEFSPAFMDSELLNLLVDFLKRYFKKVFIAHKKKIFEIHFEEALKISKEYGQRNLFLLRES